jgi:glutamyl-tRNA synthetase
MTVRTRFAPSPTGLLHVGGIRTALFAWLLARQNNGQFILRLEDTDQNREVTGADQHIINSLKALGLNYDEGPDADGKYGPYRQSERLDIYKQWAQKLIDAGQAYTDPYTPEKVQAFRVIAQKEKKPFLYRNHRPESANQKVQVWDDTKPLRFKSDPKAYKWHDEVMGDLSTGPEVVDDFVLIKSDGFPTYNFAHIVDDAEMKISHVIRGQEFLASVPNYLNLYEALEITPPKLATMPHILGADGNKKLSKRDGAKDVLDYIKDGYLLEALISFIATLGWNDGSTQEVFTTDELIKKFSLDRVGKSGARFDDQRLTWVNGHFIRELTVDELYKKITDYWPKEAAKYDDAYKKSVLGLIQERLKIFNEIPELTSFFFTDLPIDLSLITEHKQLKKLNNDELKTLLQAAQTSLTESDFTLQDLTNRLNSLLTISHTKPVVLFSLIRIATTQAPFSPGLADTLAVLGKDRSLQRINSTLNALR